MKMHLFAGFFYRIWLITIKDGFCLRIQRNSLLLRDSLPTLVKVAKKLMKFI